MTAPSFVQSGSDSGSVVGGTIMTGFTLGVAPTAGNTLVMAMYLGETTGVALEIYDGSNANVTSSWTQEYAKVAWGSHTRDSFILRKTATGAGDQTIKLHNQTGVTIGRVLYAACEYDLQNGDIIQTAENVQIPNAGFAAGPSITYGSGRRVIFGACFNAQAPGGMAAVSPATPRLAVLNTLGLAIGDVLVDSGGGTTQWNYTNTGGADSDSVAAEIVTPVPGQIILLR